MSLRDRLKQAVNATSVAPVACCMPIGMQHATFPSSDATGNATIVQLPPATPREYLVSDATAYATTVQLEAETDATFGPEIEGESCTPVASALTAHRKVKELIEAAMLACDHWQDDEDARQQMRDDCAGIPPDKRQDWIDHFSRHYRR